MPEYYGDLDDSDGVEACDKSAVFDLELIFMAFQRWRKPILCSDHDDKTIILTGLARAARYRFFPVK